MVILSAGFALLPGWMFGFERNIQYLGSALGGLGHFASIHTAGAASTVSISWIRSVSITSASARLLEHCDRNSGHAILLASMVGLACLLAARQLYRHNGVAMFPAGSSISSPGMDAVEGLVALEWVGLMVFWLAFGPEVSRRHMYVLLLMDVIAVALLCKSSGSRRLVLIAGLVLCQLTLRIPSGHGCGPLASAINWAGGASWALLIFYGSLLSTGFVWMRTVGGAPAIQKGTMRANSDRVRPHSPLVLDGLPGDILLDAPR